MNHLSFTRNISKCLTQFTTSTRTASNSSNNRGHSDSFATSEPGKWRPKLYHQKIARSTPTFGIPLTTGQKFKKRPEKSTIPVAAHESLFNISAYGVARAIDLQTLRNQFIGHPSFHCVNLASDLAQEVILLVTTPAPTEANGSQIFLFRNGVVVLWNLHKSKHSSLLNLVRQFSEEPLLESLIESEELDWCFSDKPTQIVGENIYLQNRESRLDDEYVGTQSGSAPSPTAHITPVHETDQAFSIGSGLHLIPLNDPVHLEQFALSDALSLSVKLSLLENSFDVVAAQMEPWIENMRSGYRIKFPESAVLQKTGELFTLRHSLNVSTPIIDTPDIYWDRPAVESLYNQLKSVLSVSTRIRVLNLRLNMCCELTEILSNHLQSKHASRLESMIILLILIEIFFEAFYYYERQQGRINPIEP